MYHSKIPKAANTKSDLNLLVSVYLSPNGLGKYSISKVQDKNDPFFRISRFISGLISLQKLDFHTVKIFFDTDPIWEHTKPKIESIIGDIFPTAEVSSKRLLYRPEWDQVTSSYASDDLILLHCNDDHAYVCQKPELICRCCEYLKNHQDVPLCAVTHHPEMVSLVYNRGLQNVIISDFGFEVDVDYAVGTTLVRADFLQSWWAPRNFQDTERIAKPDNPLGKSVQFDPVKMLIPSYEILRHMDGYGHVRNQRPLAPLKNLIRFNDIDLQNTPYSQEWLIGLWPSRIFGLSGKGVDLHAVQPLEKSSFFHFFRTQVASLQAVWCFKFDPSMFGLQVPKERKLSWLQKRAVLICACLTWPVFRNFPDYLISRTFLRRGNAESFHRPNYLQYHGPVRSLLMRRSWRELSKALKIKRFN